MSVCLASPGAVSAAPSSRQGDDYTQRLAALVDSCPPLSDMQKAEIAAALGTKGRPAAGPAAAG